MPNVLRIVKDRFRAALAKLAPETAEADPVVTVAKDPRFGDYQANAAMGLARVLGRKPRDIADSIVERLDVDDLCAKVDVAGPGFINVTLRDDWLGSRLAEAWADPRLGVPEADPAKTVVIDYCSPNLAKPMHVGHLRGTIIGDAVTRILRFGGHTVISDNHIGDWGTQFGLLIVGFRRHLDEAAFQTDALAEVVRVYKQVSAEAKQDKAIQEEARQAVVELQSGQQEARTLWEQMTAVTHKEMDRVLAKLGVRLDEILPESFYQPMLADVVAELQEKGIAVESQGAICIFDPDDEDAPPLIIRKGDGAFLYGTTDLAAVKYRVERWDPDEIIYETDDGQRLHFGGLFKAVRRWGHEQVELTHIVHGKVLGADGTRLKTRSGDTPLLEDLLDAAVEHARRVVDEKSARLPEAQRQQIAEAVGVGAVKYADLSVTRTSDYRFDLDRMVSVDGDTAPYLQYAFARTQSIFRRGGIEPGKDLAGLAEVRLNEPAERDLGIAVLRLTEVLTECLADYRPHVLTSYLYDLSQKFSAFWHHCPVLKAEDDTVRSSRLALCDLTARILDRGLDLLGIRTIPQM